MEDDRLSATRKREMAWASLDDVRHEIDRIAQTGPRDERDFEIIRRALLMVNGELKFREAERHHQIGQG